MKKKSRSKREKKPKKEPVHIAVVVRTQPGILLPRMDSLKGEFRDWSAFMGTDQKLVIQQAITAVRKWGADTYEIWTGTLTGKVSIPVNFKVVKL